jgi:periplasmic divalent cation tolerance protein
MDTTPQPASVDAIAVVTTVGQRADAERIGRALVERGLAACAQIEAIESFYVWGGALQHDAEFRLLLKTTRQRYDEVESALRELHPYELPAIHALAFERAYAPYAAWVEARCRPPPGDSD